MDLDASKVSEWADKLEFPLAAVGFAMGATEANPGANFYQRSANFLSALGIGGVTIPGPNGTSYTSVPGQLKFNPTGFLNKGLAAAVILGVGKDLIGTAGTAGKIMKVAYDVGEPIAVGYALGGFLDPPPGPLAGATYGAGNASQATTAAAFNSGSMR